MEYIIYKYCKIITNYKYKLKRVKVQPKIARRSKISLQRVNGHSTNKRSGQKDKYDCVKPYSPLNQKSDLLLYSDDRRPTQLTTISKQVNYIITNAKVSRAILHPFMNAKPLHKQHEVTHLRSIHQTSTDICGCEHKLRDIRNCPMNNP